MKRLLLLLIIILSFPLIAEEGEFQFFMGSGLYLPQEQYTQDQTVYIYSTVNFPMAAYFGITDNFDIGIQGSYASLTDTNFDSTYEGLAGIEYNNYSRLSINVQARYNLFPGYYLYPHAILGIGNNIETYKDREFYVNDEQYNQFDEEDYTDGSLNFQVGFDLVYEIWWIFLARAEVLYNHSENNQSVEANIYFGTNWMLKTYGGR